MPVYDSVVGARLETTRVADPAAADAQFALAVSGDDLSASDRERELAKLAAIPGVKADFIIESEEGSRYLLVIEDGRQTSFDIVDSRAADHVEPARGTALASARTKVPVDDVLELFADADCEDAEQLGDDELQLPYRWNDRATMLAALAKIGPLLDGGVMMLVEIDDRRYDVELAYGAVTCTPLHPLCGARTEQVLAIAAIGACDEAVTVPFAKPPKSKPTPKVDPARPFVSGTVSQREDAWNEHTEYGRKRRDLASTIAAVMDEANRDKRYADLRRRMYHYLAKYDTPEVCAVWLWALREESDDVAETVTYIGWRLESVIARLPDELRAAGARGDQRTASRIRRLQAEAR